MAPIARASRFQLRRTFNAWREELKEAKAPRLFAALNLSTIAFAAWTLWTYLSYGKAQQELTIKQQQIDARQSAATSSAMISQARLSAENASLDGQLKRVALADASSKRIRSSHELNVYAIDRKAHLYEGYFQVQVENTSRTPLELSWAVFEWYVGTLDQTLGDGAVLEINAPPKRERDLRETGPITWEAAGRKGFLYRSSTLLDRPYFARRPYFQQGGGPTKRLSPGDTAEYTMPLLIRAGEDRWIGVAIVFGVDGGKVPENIFWASKWFPLRTVDDPVSDE